MRKFTAMIGGTLLGAVTTIFLIIIPALAGGAAALLHKHWRNGAA